MDIIQYFSIGVLWLLLIMFWYNFKAAGFVTKYYAHSPASIKSIHTALASTKDLNKLRASLKGLASDKTVRYDLTFLERVIKTFSAVTVKRVVIEQVVILNFYFDIRHDYVSKFSWNRIQIETFLKSLNLSIKNYEEKSGVKIAQLDRIYLQHQILLNIAKRYKLSTLEIYVLRPIYKDLFRGVDLNIAPIGLVESLATETIDRSGYKELRIRYATMFALKMLFLYQPSLNAYLTTQQLKSATEF